MNLKTEAPNTPASDGLRPAMVAFMLLWCGLVSHAQDATLKSRDAAAGINEAVMSKLGWKVAVQCYTYHKLTLFEALENIQAKTGDPRWRISLCALTVLVFGIVPALQAADLVKARDGSGVFGYKDTPKLPGCDYVMHDPDRPLPPRVQVGPPGPPVPPPSDAVVLFDGKDLSAWQPSNWKVEDGQIVAGAGKLVSKASFGDVQVHAEWMAPADFKGPWYGSGNNGVTLMDQFEIQIFDSANPDIKLYADGECGAIYGQTPPLVNVCRKAGEWQSFDIFFTAPVFEQGKLVKPARVTALQNGVLIHLNQEIYGETRHRVFPAYKQTNSVAPISLPAHYCPVRFRNIWARPLK